jgi:hypothetical protein
VSSPDLINGLFECFGGLLLCRNCVQLYRDKMIRGVTWPVTLFFAAWGFWNCFYYPHLDQWLSFSGGLVIVSANTVWVTMAIFYTRRERRGV